jgi:hypothetical protein
VYWDSARKPKDGNIMKKPLLLIGTVFAVTLAVVIGTRMSPDAMAVVVGIVCGVLASIPTSVILVWVLRLRDKQLDAQLNQARPLGQYPPVVVVNGQGHNGSNGSYPPSALTAGAGSGGARNFKVVGQENTETVGDVLPPFWEEL